MRFTSGLIVGILLTVGTAYVADALRAAPGGEGANARRMVNWDVVNDNMRGLSTSVQEGWHRLVGDAKKVDKQTRA